MKNKIKVVMEKKGITDREICYVTNLSLPTLYNVKKGKNVTLNTADKIARALGESIDSLFYREEEEAA